MSAGLRRFATPASAAEPAPARCELCAEPLPEHHSHLVDLTARTIACGCRACYLLFTAPAAGARYRAVPERYLHIPELPLTGGLWERLGIPVGLAFLFTHSGLEQPVALYPSPAGATESLPAPDAWGEVTGAVPAAAGMAADVEALLVHRVTAGGPDRFEGFVVPIDACYALVGLVRRHWRGFDGGAEAWQAIEVFLADLRARGVPAAAVGRG